MSASPALAWSNPQSEVRPDPKAALAFFAALYGSNGDVVHFRSVPEPKREGEHATNHHYALNEDFSANVRGFLDYCAATKQAAFFLPGVVQGHGTGKKDVTRLAAVLIDFDKGDPTANLAAAEALLGPATVVVESGGQIDGKNKLHAYWRVPEQDTYNVNEICRLRSALAERFGGDTAFKQQAQVARLPRSIHFKSAPRLVQLRTLRPEAVYSLEELASKCGIAASKPGSNPFDFSNVSAPVATVADLRSMYVQTEGKSAVTRWEWFNRVAGAEIADVRAGRKSLAEAERYMLGAVQRNMEHPEDWDDARVAREFAALVRVDVEARGQFVQTQPMVLTGATGKSVTEWNIKRFAGAGPARSWLVDGLIPTGTAGVFAAVGDAGKSMMALRLAYIIGCYPEPQRGADFDFDVPRFFGQPVTARGAAVILTAEDDASEVHRRIAALDTQNLRAGNPRVYVRPMLSDGGPRAIIAEGPAGVQPTDFWRELRDDLGKIPDLKLLVLDPLSHFAAAQLDKDNQAGAALMAMLGAFAAETGAAVMLVHHMGKAAQPSNLTDARTAVRGAGSLVDNGRWTLAMWEAAEDTAQGVLKTLGQEERARAAGVVYLGGLAKGNAPSDKVLRTLVRNAATGLLEDVTEQLAAARPQQAELDEAALAALRAEARDNARFLFGRGEQTLHKAWTPIFEAAGVSVPRAGLVALFLRLQARKLLERTDTIKGGHHLFAMKLDG